MLTGDRIRGAVNARRVVATLDLAGTSTPARRWNERTPASPAWRMPLPLGRRDQTFAVVLAALLVPPSSRAADASGAARQLAGRAGRKNGQGCRVNEEAGGPASCWQCRLYAPCADRSRSVTVRSVPSSAPGIQAGDASRRSKTATRRCGMMRPDRGPRRLRASDRLTRGLTKSRRNGPCGGHDRR